MIGSRSRPGAMFAAALGLVWGLCASAPGDLLEPKPSTSWRALRSGHVKTWHIFNDSNTDGILNPFDTRIDEFKNWWTPVSAHTQHNYTDGNKYPFPGGATFGPGEDMLSAPMNFATATDAGAENYWLPRESGAIGFYMTYSQYDNNDWATFAEAPGNEPFNTMHTGRNRARNGWAFGWLIDDITYEGVEPNQVLVKDANAAGSVDMDIFVHNGRDADPNVGHTVPGFGTSRSDPQVSMSNDIDYQVGVKDWGPQWHPPTYSHDSNSYDPNSTVNQAYKSFLGISDANFQVVVNSMEVREYDSYGPAVDANAVDPNRTPSKIRSTLTEHDGNTPYEYQDAFLNRSRHTVGATDGGVIAGLRGDSNYTIPENNWADQQVIRIDLSAETFADGNISKLIFFDFGDSVPGSVASTDPNQVNPRKIVFLIDANQTVAHGQIYWVNPADPNEVVWFPENRIYIAQVVPEPLTAALVLAGGAVCLLKVTRRTRRPADPIPDSD